MVPNYNWCFACFFGNSGAAALVYPDVDAEAPNADAEAP
jgi:hypothetical protein